MEHSYQLFQPIFKLHIYRIYIYVYIYIYIYIYIYTHSRMARAHCRWRTVHFFSFNRQILNSKVEACRFIVIIFSGKKPIVLGGLTVCDSLNPPNWVVLSSGDVKHRLSIHKSPISCCTKTSDETA